MSIKQLGGVFGRNPEFNDLTVKDLTVNGPSDLNGSLAVTGTVGLDGAVVVNDSGADVDFRIEGDTQANLFYVDASTNRIGLNTSGPAEKLHLVDSDPKIHLTRTSDFYYGKVSADGFAAYTNTNGAAPVILKTATTARLTVEAGGDVLLNTGNLKVQSGKGIDFSATSGTGTSELFDDYEEGTWTPVLAGLVSAGAGTYTSQVGLYTKIGDFVYASFYIVWTAHTGTGVASIDGLPFASKTFTDGWTAANISYVDNVPLSAGKILSGYQVRNTDYIQLGQIAVGGGAWANLLMENATSGGIIGSVVYKTN